MLKKIHATDLKPGMYIHEVSGDWWSHPFLRNRFKCNGHDIEKILRNRIAEVYIDTELGLDTDQGRPESEVRAEIDAEIAAVVESSKPLPLQTSIDEEMGRAVELRKQAWNVVSEVMRDVRLGNAVETGNVGPLVDEITDSVLRNSGALLSLMRLKSSDEYTFLHSVAVSTMMITFGRSIELDAETVREGGIGGLLHDVGKMRISDEILNKPGRLTDAEFDIIKAHPAIGHELLLETPGIGPIPLDITRHHHERMDSSGYPDAPQPEALSQMARMAAIVDVYDAITSDRCYHSGLQPTEALRKMWEWSEHHFDQRLLQLFMRTVGIYPVGSLVRLSSERLGVVVEQGETSLTTPHVRAFYDTRTREYVKPVLRVLEAVGCQDRILSAEDPATWGVDPMRFLLAERA